MQPFESSHANDIDFNLHDFLNSGKFEQFMDMFRGENCDPIFAGDIMLNAKSINQFNLAPVDIFSFNSMSASDHQIISSLPLISGDLEGGGDEKNANYSSDTTTTTPMKRMHVDRSRTLASERKRRGRMKEKLYALRALVPNITKMDKASIIGDAVSYVHNLQMEAKKLNSEIATLELSLKGQQTFHGSIGNWTKTQVVENRQPICKNIVRMDVFQIEENEYYVRLVCNKGVIVAPGLYKALESLTWVDIQSSNLALTSEQYVLTLTIKIAECRQEINLSTIKLWVAGTLMNQGFEFNHIQPPNSFCSSTNSWF